MNESSNENIEPQREEELGAPLQGPGRRLREARERLGLDQSEVAKRLLLSTQLVRAMEEDDYATLPASAFVFGYLRNYAHLLELPEEEILEAYNAFREAPPALVSNMRDQKQVQSSDLPVRLVTYLIILGLAILLGMWWFSRHARLAETPKPAPAAPTKLTSPAVGEVPAPQPAAPKQAIPSAQAPAAVTAPATPAAPAPAPASGANPAVPAPAPYVPPPAAKSAEPVKNTLPTLTLTFSAECWTQISDASGVRLVSRLVPKGQSLTVQGKAPFKVVLGYAPGAQVTYNGKPFDMSRFEHQQVARFSVGSAADNSAGAAE